MRRIVTSMFVGLLALGAAAACDEDSGKKGESVNKGDDEFEPQDDTDDDGAGGDGVEDFCNDAAQFIADVEADPSNTALFDEGEALVEEGQELAATGENTARAEECTQEVISALADIGE